MALEHIKIFLIVSLVSSFCFPTTLSRLLDDELIMQKKHDEWMAEHGRTYADMNEKNNRYVVFKRNVERIERLNNVPAGRTFKLAVNQFADLTNDEFRSMYTGYKGDSVLSSQSQTKSTSFRYQNVSSGALPIAVDWRKKGAVTPIKNQGSCGCCWAFSAVAAIEGATQIKKGKLISLSEQQLVDCDTNDFGCSGGLMDTAFEHIMATGGLTTESNYPYKGEDANCKIKSTKPSAASITGFYAPCSHPQVSNHLTLLSSESLPSSSDEQSSTENTIHGNRNKCPVPGTLYNTNTVESFTKLDKQSLLKSEANKIWEDIQSGKALEDCALLSRFLVISFADLKKWSFRYWFAFPALVLDPPASLVELKPASEYFTSEEAESVSAACNEWRDSSLTTDVPFFLVSVSSDDSKATITPLKDWEACQGDHHKLLFGFYDPCHLPSNPGWPLRNYLALIRSKWNLETVWFFCYRESRGFADMSLSLVGQASITLSSDSSVPNSVGWELNKGKRAPRSISLANSMDPTRLAVSACDLNLKLMRWRALPSLDLNVLSSVKCLLLGAGTLGCQVARTLMGWGIRNITFVDYGKVAMSNPVRQSLYTFEDCVGRGEFKAVAAVKSLKQIFPAVESSGVVMAIPMPGHPISSQEEESVLGDCKRLRDLIESHDAVFLLTDTRESRWLPSLLCANANKIAINAALGFDSYMVMRHGAGPNSLSDDMQNLDINKTGRQRLGCYFCNDVVAPQDSMTDRTLDQQCTVTRPGLAPIAGALAVELLVGVLQHPLGIYAKGDNSSSSNGGNSDESPLGILPHQIRGSVSQFSQITLLGQASNSCTACSETVVSEYREKGNSFILEAINHPTYLEDLTGLTELKKAANSFSLDWEDDGDDDEAVDM